MHSCCRVCCMTFVQPPPPPRYRTASSHHHILLEPLHHSVPFPMNLFTAFCVLEEMTPLLHNHNRRVGFPTMLCTLSQDPSLFCAKSYAVSRSTGNVPFLHWLPLLFLDNA